jgi:hypothetical protein
MSQPNRPQQGIIPLLIQKQLSRMSQSGINLTILIDIRSYHPGSRLMMQIEDAAFADIDEKTNVLLASMIQMLE